jgi:hypothetical protein
LRREKREGPWRILILGNRAGEWMGEWVLFREGITAIAEYAGYLLF